MAVVIDVLVLGQQPARSAGRRRGALAGAPYLPASTVNAYKYARDEATKNGYKDGVGSIVVTPVRTPLRSAAAIRASST